MLITHRQVEAFRAVVRTGTTVEAALVLHTSQPSISRLIGELEVAVQLKLFDRLKGRLVPTAEGVAFYDEVRRSFAGLQRLSEAAAGLAQFRGRELRIGSLPVLGLVLLPGVVARFQSRYPDVRMVLGVADSTNIREWVAYQQVEVGYVEEGIEPLECDARLLFRVPAVVVVRPGHPLTKQRVVTAKDLDGMDFVHLWRGHGERRQIDEALAHARVSVTTKAETQYAIGVCALVAEGVGVGIVNPIVLLGAVRFDVEVRPFQPTLEFGILELNRRGKRPDALADEFVRMARTEFEAITCEQASPGWPGGRIGSREREGAGRGRMAKEARRRGTQPDTPRSHGAGENRA
jgi:DNA-binding transcriptional LysR family regulator